MSLFHHLMSTLSAICREFLDSKSEITNALQEVQEVGDLYWKFLQNGIQFLDELVMQLQEHCKFDLEEYLEDPIKMTQCSKQVCT
jgi:Telomerase activating protein Est1.